MSNSQNHNARKTITRCFAVLPLVMVPNLAMATDFDAKAVMNNMSTQERSAYIAGIVEGMAYDRYLADGKTTDAMGCIYDWLYQNDKTLPAIYDAFERFPDFAPGAIMAAMIEKECG